MVLTALDLQVAHRTSRGRKPSALLKFADMRPDGMAVAVTDPGGVAVWDITPDRIADAACRLARRNLTPTEWDTYLAGLGRYRATCPRLPPATGGSTQTPDA